jgi:hypothetical protein
MNFVSGMNSSLGGEMGTGDRNTNFFRNQKGGGNGRKKDRKGETMGFGTWV